MRAISFLNGRAEYVVGIRHRPLYLGVAMGPEELAKTHQKLLRAWQLAIIRFAVTLDGLDRLNVFVLGEEIDRFGRKGEREATLHYFRRSSVLICSAIHGQRENAESILLRYLAEIEDPRVKRTFAAAVGIRLRPTPRQHEGLFRGLPSRKVDA